MKDVDDWNIILETVDALFCSLADGIARRAGMMSDRPAVCPGFRSRASRL